MGDDYQRTVISITDEFGEPTTITLDKWVSDVLHAHLKDVHTWVQRVYDRVCEHDRAQSLDLSRRQKGDQVRSLAGKKALDFEPIEIDLTDFDKV